MATKRDSATTVKALCWKNWLVARKNRRCNLASIIVPIAVAGLLVVFKTALKPESSCTTPGEEGCYWEAFKVPLGNVAAGVNPATCPSQRQAIHYTPDTPAYGVIVASALQNIQNGASNGTAYANATLVAETSEAAIVTAYRAATLAATGGADVAAQACFVGVVFTSATSFTIRLPYTPGGYTGQTGASARSWLTGEITKNTFWSPGPRSSDEVAGNTAQYGAQPGYPVHQFVTMQWGLSKAIAGLRPSPTAVEALDALLLQRMPFPAWNNEPFPKAFIGIGPVFLMVGFIFAGASIVRDIVAEKELKLKAALMMMGLRLKHHWIAWWIRGMTPMVISWTVVTIVIKAGNVLEQANFTIVLVVGYLASAATMSFACLVASLVQKASIGAFAGAGLLYLMFLPFSLSFQDPATADVSTSSQGSMCLASSSCFGLAMSSMAQFDIISKPLPWGHIDETVNGYLPVGTCMLYLLFDAIVYFLLALYIEQVRPGEYGIPRSVWFPLHDLVSCLTPKPAGYYGITGDGGEAGAGGDGGSSSDDDCVREVDPRDRPTPGIKITNLVKEFTNPESDSVKRAVDRVSMSMYPGEITAFLGQNGAGKTTTMSMLCGLFPATSGSMTVAGADVETNLAVAQSSLGVCPQHDVLWAQLTVEQHLRFFARLKGLPTNQIDGAVRAMISDLQLEEKESTLSKDLSGGQKRRLSVGIALIGGSTVVVLDEPSSGCDPEARRAIWDLLLSHKAGRTILLSTHFMDEADQLGDQISIISAGKLICVGSSQFLKGQYGVGHNITIAKLPGSDATAIKATVLTHIPDASTVSEIGSELQMKVPSHAIDRFPALLRELETRRAELKVDSFGVSATTLEEVFLTAGVSGRNSPSIAITDDFKGSLNAPLIQESSLSESTADGLTTKLLPGWAAEENPAVTVRPNFSQQFHSIRKKRIMLFLRNRFSVMMLLIVPAIAVIFGAYSNSSQQPAGADNSQAIQLTNLVDTYGDTNVQLFGCGGGGAASCMIAKNYLATMPGATPRSHTSRNFSEYAGSLSALEGVEFNANNAVGLTIDTANTTTAWFNGQNYHSVAEALSVATNVLLHGRGIEVRVTNAPLPKTPAETAALGVTQYTAATPLATLLVVGIAMFSAGVVDHPTSERGSSIKHIQFNSGVSFTTYWIANFTVDFSFGVLLTVVAMLVTTVGIWETFNSDGATMLILATFLLGFASAILLSYLASNLFTQSSNAIKAVIFGNLFFGLWPIIAVLIVEGFNISTSHIITSAFLWSPAFCMGQTLISLSVNIAKLARADKIASEYPAAIRPSTETICDQLGCSTDLASFEYPGVGRFLVALAAQSFVWILLLYAVEARWFRMSKKGPIGSATKAAKLDFDVLEEQQHVKELLGSGAGASRFSNPVLISDVYKAFGAKVAVDQVSISIGNGELFGLLGVNGAGKTTLFKMLTGEIAAGSGSIWIDGSDVENDLGEVQKSIGYVPQFDALIGEFTGKELLTYFANLRGMKKAAIPAEVARLVKRLDLTTHADNKCNKYSGGNKRKLCVALALIGDPPVLLLDEPTTGMDPGSKRFVWTVLLDLIREGRTIVLTTHSMEEAAALSTRMGIMVAGQLRCLGSQQHLKERFGKTVYVEIAGCPTAATATNGVAHAVSTMQASFSGVQIQAQSDKAATLAIGNADGSTVSLADLFDTMLTLRQGGISDFTVSQCTLDQIFIQQAKEHGIKD